MGEIDVTGKDIASAALSLLIAVVIISLIALAVIFLFSLGSPLVLIGVLLGLGIIGIIALIGFIIAVMSVWYIIYAFIKSIFEKEEENPTAGYTLKRIKKS